MTVSANHFEIEAKSLTALTREEFETMAGPSEDGGAAATMLLPMERKGAETRKNPIVFKNALAELQKGLAFLENGSGDGLKPIIEELERLVVPTEEFWQHQEAGLAMVVRPEAPVAAYLMPFAPSEFTYVGRRPYLSPLLPLLNGTRHWVLVLDLNEIRLLRASRWSVEEVPLQGIPRSLAEATEFDDPEKSLQSRSVSASNLPGPGGGDVAFHGHGLTGDEVRAKRVRRFFERVEDGLPGHFDDRERPLVLLGPDSEVGLYREVNHYPHLCRDDIRFNASGLSRDELRRMVCEWVALRDAEVVRAEIDDLNAHLAQGLASCRLEEVVKAASDGRVATLLAKPGEYRYGVLDRAEDRVEIHDERQRGDEEFVGMAAGFVMATGGKVVYLDEAELPEGAPVAAVFRY